MSRSICSCTPNCVHARHVYEFLCASSIDAAEHPVGHHEEAVNQVLALPPAQRSLGTSEGQRKLSQLESSREYIAQLEAKSQQLKAAFKQNQLSDSSKSWQATNKLIPAN
jgi:hypothetical protein